MRPLSLLVVLLVSAVPAAAQASVCVLYTCASSNETGVTTSSQTAAGSVSASTNGDPFVAAVGSEAEAVGGLTTGGNATSAAGMYAFYLATKGIVWGVSWHELLIPNANYHVMAYRVSLENDVWAVCGGVEGPMGPDVRECVPYLV